MLSKKKFQLQIRLNDDIIGYFKELSKQSDILYQTLIDVFLADCATKERKHDGFWE